MSPPPYCLRAICGLAKESETEDFDRCGSYKRRHSWRTTEVTMWGSLSSQHLGGDANLQRSFGMER